MKKEKQAETLLVIVLLFIIIYLKAGNKYFLFIALMIGILGLLFPFFAHYISWLWQKISDVLGFIASRILLSFVFVFILLPLSLLAKLFGKTQIISNTHIQTYFKYRNHTYTKKDLENQW
ncbi:MAG: hypothetical protein JST87_00760 [Bacteroidetes bacterium]|nr:hypothetical protein [Bacteroidota bacterium]